MLTAQHLFKKYGAHTVVNDISLSVSKAEIVSINGPSGAGKSTLLHLLGGLDKPDSGSVLIEGIDLLSLPSKMQSEFRNHRIGFVFQFHHLLPEFTALENVSIPLWIGKKGTREVQKTSAEMLSLVGLEARMNHKPSELSGGEQQRVAIARALVTKPAIVFADEPTGNLDSVNAQSVHELFLTLRKELQQTFVMITHNDALAALTDRTVTMRDGKMVSEQNH
ncbi:MAG: ABC transporter ATP-binding protein [Bacteroidetes bacterium]|nr:ABC transporter ATP-binding protein [Bacteroidota bacterium]MBS1740921.1 ABC transporter ATP-binding protein [Bacteroidota bacterium]